MYKISTFVLLAISVLITAGNSQQVEDNNGYVTSTGQFPWYAHIEGYSNGYLVKPCAGSIISSTFVMTSAYCGRFSESFHVSFGNSNFTMGSEDAIVSTVFISHPLFNDPSLLANNIALIQLPTQISFSDAVQPIKLPFENVDETSLHTFFVGSRSTPAIFEMRWHFSQVITTEECDSLIYLQYLGATTMCTVGPTFNLNQKPCSLIDGAVLAYFINNTWIQADMQSVRGSYCDNTSADIFTRVDKFIPWITAVTGLTV